MPIDFAAIAAAFKPPLTAELKTIAGAYAALGKWLGKELKKAQGTDRATRGIPTLRFVGRALAVRVAPFQRGVLTPGEAAPTLVQRVGGGFRRMGENLGVAGRRWTIGRGLVGRMVTEATALPRFVDVLGRAADLIAGAVSAYVPPTAAVFSLTAPRTASDVFGGLGLGVYALYAGSNPAIGLRRLDEPLGVLRHLARTASNLAWGRLADPLREALRGLRTLFPASDEEPPPTWQVDPAVRPTALTLPEMLREAVHGIAGALLVLPLLVPLLQTLLDAGVLRAKLAVLDVLEAIEEKIFGVRRRIIDLFFVRLRAFGVQAFDVLTVLGILGRGYVRFFVRFAWRYVRTLVAELVDYFRDVIRFTHRLEQLGRLLGGVVDGVLDLDMGRTLMRALGLTSAPTTGLTLRGLVTALTTGGATALRRQLHGLIDEALDSIPFGLGPVVEALFRARIQAARDVINQLVVDVGHVPTAAYTPYAGPPLPNVYDTFFGSWRGGILPELRRAARGFVVGSLSAGETALDELAVQFDRAAREAARAGDVNRYAAVLAWADEVAGLAFGDQVRALRRREGAPSPMARAFEELFGRGGFYTLGALIPRYLHALMDYWVERRLRQAEGRFAPPSGLPPHAAPTSPHLVDRRVRLGRVRVPRLTIRAGDRPLDESLATAVVTHFRDEVHAAYRAGLDRLPAATP